MGGEGGGVLADWLVDLAETEGFVAQSTSVPGVAQRTGATIYYVEMFPAQADGRLPVLALMPAPGDVDVVIASELMEAARAVQRGLVTPDRTTLIASSHRVYAMTEKIAMSDGRSDAPAMLEACRAAAARLVVGDMAGMAEVSGSVISAVLFGALAGAGVLPFARSQFEDAVRRGGVGVEASLRAFARGFAAAADPAPPAPPPVVEEPIDVIALGEARLVDYQDAAYAQEFRDRLAPIRALDAAHGDGRFTLLEETARALALAMSYEDTVRVADLKIRASRFARVRAEVQAAPGQIMRIREVLHPRVEEIADSLPASLGWALLRDGPARRIVARLCARGRVVETTSVHGFLLLWLVAHARRFRRGSLRHVSERARWDDWLARIAALAPHDYALAVEVARCQSLVRGYGDTHARGLRSYGRTMRAATLLQGYPDAAVTLARLREAALADDTGAKLGMALAEAGLDA
jgi:indolepyruvate ferredoxin oxidoreductase beta subunit